MRKGVLELTDLSVSIRPQNGRTINIWGIVVPFLPVPFWVPGMYTRPSQNLILHLQLETSADDFSLDPAEVRIRVADKELSPSRVRVADSKIRAGSPVFLLGPASESPGHPWSCDAPYTPRFTLDPLEAPSRAVAFNGKQCFILEYPIATFPPTQEFTVQVLGIRRGGSPVEVPPLRFERDTGLEYSLVLVQ